VSTGGASAPVPLTFSLIEYALDELSPGSTKPELVVAMVNHVLRHAELKGVYQRNGGSQPSGLKMHLPLLGTSKRT
jgi:hypothetical protein